MGRQASILIVADNHLLLETLACLRVRYRLEVLEASTGEGALATLRARGPAID